MNINQNYLPSSSSDNLNDRNQNKDMTKAEQSKYSGNNSISNYQPVNNNTKHNLIFNDVAQIESNNLIIISWIETDNNINNKRKDSYLINKNIKVNIDTDYNIKNEIGKTPKEIRKKILCMHEFSKTGYAGEDEK